MSLRDCAARALVLVVAAIVAGGCGGGEPNETSGRAQQILAAEDVDAYREGTPEHALLDWWRHAQYRDLQGFLQHFRADVRKKHADASLSRRKLDLFTQLIRNGRPEILETERDGDEAVVWTRVRFRRATGENRYVPYSAPVAFPFVREDGEWRLADDFFFESVTQARREGRRFDRD